MSTPNQPVDRLDDVFRAIADPTRRMILDLLRAEPLNTSAIVDAHASMTRAGVINHIKILEAAQLVRVEERGRERINHLNAARLQGVYERWLNPFEQIWTTRLEGLARISEGTGTQLKEKPMTEPVRAVEIVQKRSCAALPEVVWEALTTHLDQWWTHPYVAEDSTGLALHLEPGGTMWEAHADGGYAVAVVRGFAHGRELILDGEFGIPGALSGRLVVDLEQRGNDSTNITFTNTAIGTIPEDLPQHEDGWKFLIGSLAEYAERAQ